MAESKAGKPGGPVATVKNLRTGLWLAQEVRVAQSLWDKAKGLLGQSGLAPDAGLYIVPCQSIHSFFMRFSFDAVFVDETWRVLRLIEAMPPWRISPIVWRAKGVLELPAGTIGASGTQQGDLLQPSWERR